MAERFSGKGRVRLAWNDQRDYYTCRVSDGDRSVRVTVGHPPGSQLAVDHPVAFDEAARAAIAFATDAASMAEPSDGEPGGDEPLDADAFAVQAGGTWVGRSAETAWPPPPEVETLIAAAREHGIQSEPEHEVGDLQALLRRCWSCLGLQQREAIFAESAELRAWLE